MLRYEYVFQMRASWKVQEYTTGYHSREYLQCLIRQIVLNCEVGCQLQLTHRASPNQLNPTNGAVLKAINNDFFLYVYLFYLRIKFKIQQLVIP